LLTTVVLAICSLTISLFGANEDALHRMAQRWARLVLRWGFIGSEVVGLEKLDLNRNYVLVANHRSYMDTPVIIHSIPLQFRFFAKKGLFKVPLLGTHLGRAGHFSVTFDNPRESLKSMAAGAKAISAKKVSVLLFPEGGRVEGDLEPFKEGAAYIAIKAGVPIAPIAILGTREIWKMHTLRIRPGRTKVVIGEPIETAGMTIQDRGRLTEMLHAQVARMLAC
jgi:1-acyl-sn-glycerol-3-phosphate acyltransferase